MVDFVASVGKVVSNEDGQEWATAVVLSMLCPCKYLVSVSVSSENLHPYKHTFGHPGYSQACTFFPFFALLIRCVVGVYVISPAAPNRFGIVITVPLDGAL